MSASFAPEILNFHNDAAEYCRLIESLCDGTLAATYRSLLGCMSRLAKSAYELPLSHVSRSSDIEEMTHDEWRAKADKIAEAIGPAVTSIIEFYADLKDERGIDRARMLFDDLADIYRDLKVGLAAWETGSIEAAAWYWRFHYECHWGEHLFDALLTVFEIHFRLGYE